tara:strand:- start:979 stop:4713 length:3735 start_codon:yes stop_codon:yes gene_type:complete
MSNLTATDILSLGSITPTEEEEEKNELSTQMDNALSPSSVEVETSTPLDAKAILSLGSITPTEEEEVTPEYSAEEPPASIEESSITLELIEKNPELRAAAKRFVSSRLGQDDLDEDEAVELYVEHFRKFTVNEITAAGDFNYVSGVAADAQGKTKLGTEQRATAAQNLRDYQLLYTTFDKMESWGGGTFETIKDYAEGVATAPSTYLGFFLPGVGKAGGVAATAAAREGVKLTLRKALTSPLIATATGLNAMTSKTAAAIAKRPIVTAGLVEGTAGVLQNIAEQNTELAGNLRDDYSIEESIIGFGTGALASGALTAYGLKQGVRAYAEKDTGDLLATAQKAIAEKDEKALEAAEVVLKENKKVAEELKKLIPSFSPDKNPLNPENVAKGQEGWRKVAQEEGLDVGLAAGFDVSTQKRLFALGTEILKKADVTVNSDLRITEQIGDAFRQVRIDETDEGAAKFMEDLFKKYNLTGDDFANMFMADVSDAARTLQAASRTSIIRRLTGVMDNSIFNLSSETKKALSESAEALEKGDIRSGLSILKVEDEKVAEASFVRKFAEGTRKVDDLRRAAMTSMTATTVRNLLSGQVRIGFDTVTRAVDIGISRSLYNLSGGKHGFNIKNMQSSNSFGSGDIFATLYGSLNNKETQAIVSVFKGGFEDKAGQLFRELQDITSTKGVPEGQKIDALRQISKDLNALNTASDNIMKNISLVAGLKRGLNEEYARGVRIAEKDPTKSMPDAEKFDLRKIIERGEFNEVFNTAEGKDIMKRVIDDSLYFSYQQGPRRGTKGGDAADLLIKFAHSVPFITTSLMPFPRFIANAMRFTYEHSPVYLLDAGFLRFSTKNANNYNELSKAIVGTGALYGAMEFRNSEYAGEKWYHAKMPDGSNFDMRPFFPAAPFLFFADIVNKAMGRTGSDDPVFGDANMVQEAIQALSGTQFRAGSGLYALDAAVEDLVSAKDDPAKLLEIVNNFASNAVSTFTIPITASQDFYNTFLAPDEERLVRESKRSMEPGKRIDNMVSLFLQKSLARVPGNRYLEDVIAEKLGVAPSELYQSPTSAGPLRRVTPVTRQAIGILKQKKSNFFEDELDRLKISRRSVYAATGVPEADNFLRTFMGEYIETYVVPTLENNPEYKKQNAAGQKEMLLRAIKEYKSDVMDSTKAFGKSAKQEAEFNYKYGFSPLDKMEYKNKPAWARDYSMKAYRKMHPNWEKDGYDYDELLYLAGFFVDNGPELNEKQRKFLEIE